MVKNVRIQYEKIKVLNPCLKKCRWLKEQGINYPVKKIPRATIYFNDRNVRFISFKDLTSYL